MRMNGRQLLEVALQIDDSFQGVFAFDEIPSAKYCLIFNSDTRNLPGSHWMVIYEGEFFCSYASKTPFRELQEVLSAPIQTPGSTTCGQHCLYFLDRRSKQLPLDYTANVLQNDRMVTAWLCNKYDLHTNIFDGDYIYSQLCTEYRT